MSTSYTRRAHTRTVNGRTIQVRASRPIQGRGHQPKQTTWGQAALSVGTSVGVMGVVFGGAFPPLQLIAAILAAVCGALSLITRARR